MKRLTVNSVSAQTPCKRLVVKMYVNTLDNDTSANTCVEPAKMKKGETNSVPTLGRQATADDVLRLHL